MRKIREKEGKGKIGITREKRIKAEKNKKTRGLCPVSTVFPEAKLCLLLFVWEKLPS